MYPQKKLKIGLFLDTYFPMVDGVINVVDNYARLLSKNHDVTVFTVSPRKKGFDDSTLPYKIVRCNKLPVFFLDYDFPLPQLSKNFVNELNQNDFDIFHIHSPFTIGNIAYKYAKKNNIPTIITMHSQFYKDFLRSTNNIKWISKLLLKRVVKLFNSCDYCLTMNNYTQNILKDYGCTKEINILKNGCDMYNDEPLEILRNKANQKFSLKNEFVLLYVGRINLLKNLEFIINSVAKLPKNMNFKIIFAGDGRDKKYIEDLIKQHDIINKVCFLGKITDRETLKYLYARADVLLLPSTYDTDGIVKTEASCFETPTICIENTGAGSTITNNVNGFLLNKKQDENEFATLLINLEKDRGFLQKVGKKAKEDLYLTWENIVKDLEQFYFKILNNK